MKRNNKWFLILTVICLMATILPTTASLAESSNYGKVIGDGRVYVRKTTSVTSPAWFKLDPGTVCEVTGTTEVDGELWYYVEAQKPGSSKVYSGAILGEFFTMLSNAEEDSYLNGTTVSSGKSTSGVYYGYINRGGGTNFRKQPKLTAPTWDRLVKRTVVEVLTIPSVVTSDSWYKVRYDGHVGYIMAQFVTLTTDSDVINGSISTASENNGRHVQLTKSSCHLRKSPNGEYEIDWEIPGDTLPLAGSAVKKGKYTWYPVSYEGSLYYVRNDCVQVVD